MNNVIEPLINFYKKQLLNYAKNDNINNKTLKQYTDRLKVVRNLKSLSSLSTVYKHKIESDEQLRGLVKKVENETKRLKKLKMKKLETDTLRILDEMAVADLARKTNFHTEENLSNFIIKRKSILINMYSNQTIRNKMIKKWKQYSELNNGFNDPQSYIQQLEQSLNKPNTNRLVKGFSRGFAKKFSMDPNNSEQIEYILGTISRNWQNIFTNLDFGRRSNSSKVNSNNLSVGNISKDFFEDFNI